MNELQGIVNYQNFNPPVSPAFNTGCVADCTVTDCSCVQAIYGYWSSSTFQPLPDGAWVVTSYEGELSVVNKSESYLFERAVRGGS